MNIENLNHASLKISFQNGVKLLFDPWFEDYAFEGGWGLKYDNKVALDQTKDCHYLWISHFHTDHFHTPTLKKILQINPNITVICNDSFNFKFSEPIRKLGFKNIISFPERKELKLDDDIWIKRYPTTGIDNMLVIRNGEVVILNYNDCNISAIVRKNLKKKIGKIDILLNNYNHAGKLLDYPLPSDEIIKDELKDNFIKTIEAFSPSYTIPFASFHYYRAPESIKQNTSLMSMTELLPLHSSILPLNVGDRISFNNNLTQFEIKTSITTSLNQQDIKIRESSYSLERLKSAYTIYYKKINSGFYYLTFWIPSLLIRVIDLEQTISMKLSKKEFTIVDAPNDWHLSIHSSELLSWFEKTYGTDSFVVGGHFELNNEKNFPLRIKILFGLLTENKLDLKSLFRMLISWDGIRFLYNRREEILALLLSGRFMFGTRK
jgi:hypothetical protein